MKEVFVVTQGSYSDYHICGVFDDKELAQKFIGSFELTYEQMEIETYNLNPFELELKDGYKPYFLRISKEGHTSDIGVEDSDYGFGRNGEGIYGFATDNSLYLYCFAKDSAHAIKIANEKRAMLIANNQWGCKTNEVKNA